MAKMKFFDWIAITLLIIGGLNWGLVGVFNFNLVEFLFSAFNIERIIYGLVGLSAIYSIYVFAKLKLK